MSQLSGKMKKLRLQFAKDHKNWTIEDWEDVAWSDEFQFLVQDLDGRAKIWCNGVNPSCLVLTVQAGGIGSVMEWRIFSWHTLGP